MQYKTLLLSMAILAGFAAKASAQERFHGLYAGLSVTGQDYTS